MLGDFTVDPFRLSGHGYLLDQIPTPAMAKVMQQIWDGDRIVRSQRGDGYAWERGSGTPRKYLVEALINKGWTTTPCPDGPLFGEPTDGTLTLRGSYALRRFEAAQ
jgi:hypothetical protein